MRLPIGACNRYFLPFVEEFFSYVLNVFVQGTGVTFMADTDVNCRNQFANQGTLTSGVSSGPLPINK